MQTRQVFALFALAACGDGGASAAGEGTLSVLLEAEDTITDGIAAGEGAGVRDGWSVSFTKYIATIGPVDLAFASDVSRTTSADEVFAVDLLQLPPGGLELWQLDALRAGRWQFGYTLAQAGADTVRDESVAAADFTALQEGGLTYLIEGAIAREDGQSCPPASLAQPGERASNGQMNGRGDPCYDRATVTFRIAAPARVRVGPCEVDGVPGVSIPASGRQTVAITLHGDHLFFNGFPEGGEGGVQRLAQWLADCDLDLDGAVTEAELRAIGPSQLAELDERFQLGGSPITPLTSMWDYVSAQLQTQAHFQGEGECPLSP